MNAFENLKSYMGSLEIIDAHEHLPSEKYRIERKVDIFTLLHLYEYVDMTSAGYQPREGENVFVNNLFVDEEVSIEEKWAKAWPHLKNIKYGSYYRPTQIALRDLYGIEDLNEDTYVEASKKVTAANKAGLYRNILKDKCNIKYCLVQNGAITDQDPADIFIPLFADVNTYQFSSTDFIKKLEEKYEIKIEDIDIYLEYLSKFMEEAKNDGAVGFKIAANPNVLPDIEKARESFKTLLKGEKADVNLQSTALDYILTKCGEMDWPVAVHCGVWWDYRTVDSKNMIDIVQRHPKTRFDLYHLGMPGVRDTYFIAKNFPNVFLNLCWAYILSQSITEQTINEILDTVPVNKVFGFGADSCWSIEQVYGHYVMAIESLALAFSKRIEQGRLSEENAKKILKMWLYDNPADFYGLS